MKKIFYAKPSITKLEIDIVNDAIKNGWGEECYDYIERFEGSFKKHLGVQYAIATSSCTGALHLGLAALSIKSGDEVILADINWIATVAPIAYLGAKPVFVDILPDSWCLDPKKVESAITKKTKAIIVVHLYGNLAEMKELVAIGKRHHIPVIEDAAEAIGSSYQGKKAGSMGLFGTFSFHGSKTITTGEGGMFVTNNKAFYEKVITLSNHGRSPKEKRQFWPDRIGYKYKMSNVQAALGFAQMKRIKILIEKKRYIFNYYRERLRKLPLRMNPEPKGMVNGYWMPTVVVNEGVPFNRQSLLDAFKKENIDGRVFFWPLSMLGMFPQVKENKVSYQIYKQAVNLPSYHDITNSELDRVIKVIGQFLG